MLPRVTRICSSRVLSHNLVTSSLCRCLTRQKNVRSQVVGYLKVLSGTSSNKSIVHCPTIEKFRLFTSSTDSSEQELTPLQFVKISDQTLDSLTEYFDEVVEQATHLLDADVSYGDGVLTVKLGNPYGTYVINRQTPNKQIWLSSPKSGPKRYDFVNGKWIYRHDGKSLHQLLNEEIPAITKNVAHFDQCSFSGS